MANPGDRPLDNPSLGKDFKADDAVQALDDLDDPGTGLFRRLGGLRALITAVGIDASDERKQPARSTVEYLCDAVAVLDVGGMDDDVQQQAERIDQDVALATGDFLPGIVALGVERRPPF